VGLTEAVVDRYLKYWKPGLDLHRRGSSGFESTERALGLPVYLQQITSRFCLLSLRRPFLGRFFPGDSFVLYRHFDLVRPLLPQLAMLSWLPAPDSIRHKATMSMYQREESA